MDESGQDQQRDVAEAEGKAGKQEKQEETAVADAQKKQYSLVVVDDEAAIRRGMCKFIDWAAMGFYVAADFEDGKETIEYLKEHPADVVLTDVEMAEVSGLQVAKFIFENMHDTKVVIISGYREFEYVRQALQYNAVDYILKPIRMDEMEKVFLKIYGQLEEEEEKRKGSQMKRQDFEEILPELQEQFWASVLLGGLHSRDNIIRKRELLHLDFSTRKPCAVVDVELQLDRDMTQKYYLEKHNRYNLVNNIFGGETGGLQFHPVYLSPRQLKVVVTVSKESPGICGRESFEAALKSQLERQAEEVQSLLLLQMTAELESIFGDFTELTEHYDSLQIHVQKKNAGEYTLNPEDYERLLQKYRLVMDTINSGDFEALDCLMGNIMFELRSLPLQEVKSLLVDLFSMLTQKFMKMSTELWREVKEILDYSAILNALDRESLKKVCSGVLRQMTDIVGRRQSEVSRNIMEKVKDYLKQHFSEDISLDMLAERYYLNSSYLCRLFKQYTGSCLTDYLIDLRMERAKELLLTGKYKVYEVSRQVGYRSDKYFFRVFKQYTGQSPSEFCRSQMDESRV